jgi:hypothetical protein
VKSGNPRNPSGENVKRAASNNRLPLLAALLVCLALIGIAIGVAVALTAQNQPVPNSPGATQASVEYITEQGAGAAEGVADSPLHVEAHFPRPSESPDEALSVVLIELVDEKGIPAQYNGETPKPVKMSSTIDLAVWTYDGSLPSLPGVYHPRFTLRKVFGSSIAEIVELSGAPLKVNAESGAPLRSGYVYNDASDLWLLSSDASRRRRLTFLSLKGTNQYADAPSWSPDGTRIAFTYLPEVARTEAPATDIWVVNSDRTGMKQLVAHGAGEALSAPYWSSDGKYLYFTVEILYPDSATPEATQPVLGGSTWRIDRVEVATGARSEWTKSARMPATGGPDDDVVYLEIVAAGAESSGGANSETHRLVRANRDGGGRVVLVDNIPAFSVIAPRLSPDGKWVVYASTVPVGGGSNGSQSRPFDFFKWLLFEPEVAEAHGLPWDLFMVSTGGGAPVRLTTLGDDEPHAVWLDSSTITFVGVKGFFTLKIDAAGKPIGDLARLGDGSLHAGLTWHGP